MHDFLFITCCLAIYHIIGKLLSTCTSSNNWRGLVWFPSVIMRHMLGLTKHLQEYFTGFTIQVQRRNFRYSIDNSVNCSLYSQMCIGLKCILDIENYGYSVNERRIDTYSIETLSHACSVRKNHQHTTTYTYLLCICR